MRNVGLDIARSIAIIMVLICHSTMFFTQYADVQRITITGFFGVEIFFVLSGFLIGRIIIKSVVEKPSLSNLLTFYKRRWYRTLPLYFLMVLVLFLVGKQFHWTNLIFLQNFGEVSIKFFPVSWSLSIEEWFYLTVPFIFLVVFSFVKVKNKGVLFLGVTTSLLIFFNGIRVYEVIANNPSWDFGVRRQIFLRIDSILTGVLIAGISIYFKEFYNSLKVSYLYVISIVGIFLCGYYCVIELEVDMEILDSSFFGRTFLFSFVSLFFGVLIVALEKTDFSKLRSKKLITFVSVTSYAVYLVHLELFLYLIKYNSISVQWSLILLIISLIITYVVSYLLYKYYEQPFMKLRDKKFLNKRGNIDLKPKQSDTL